MTRRGKAEQTSGYTVLLVDDNPDYLQATKLLLEREGHNVLIATNGAEALSILPQQKVDLLLLDYFMPGMTGEQVVTEIRKFDPFVQVILQTGYASEHPPRELLHRLNIQGYYDKTEGPEQLLLWTAVGLKAASTIELLFKMRRGVEFILDKASELHEPRPLAEVAQTALGQMIGLLSRFDAQPKTSGFVAMLDPSSELLVHAGTGPFALAGRASEVVPEECLSAIDLALRSAEVSISPLGTILPLRLGPVTLGAVFLDRPIAGDQALELCRMIANQAAAALQIAQLYELAAVDVLTSAFTPAFFGRMLLRELSASLRAQRTMAFLIVDVDDMKAINASIGHLVGDRVLSGLANVLSEVTRAGDIIGRYDGDAFGVVLRDPEPDGPERLGERVLELLRERQVLLPSGEIQIGVSIGFVVVRGDRAAPGRLDAGSLESLHQEMRERAEAALDEARRTGGRTVRGAIPIGS